MRKMLILFFVFILSAPAMAGRFKDTIAGLSRGNSGEDHLIFLQSGRVIFLDPRDELPKIGQRIEAEVDEGNKLISIMNLPSEDKAFTDVSFSHEIDNQVTVLDSYNDIAIIFNRMNRSWKETTECTDRAHIWTYEEWKRSGLISKKAFLFFTNTYIRRYNYHWWFHVAPYTLLKDGNNVVEYALDRKHNSSPLPMKDWSDTFIRSKRDCPTVTYRHYRANKNSSAHCFLVKSNMYNRLPYHVRMEEDNGRIQKKFNLSEVNFSYQAFRYPKR